MGRTLGRGARLLEVEDRPRAGSWRPILELPVGDRVRVAAHRAATLFTERLAHPALLIPLAMGGGDPGVLGDGAPYEAADGGASAAGRRRGGLVWTWPLHGPGWMLYATPAELDGPLVVPQVETLEVWPYAACLALATSAPFGRLMARLGDTEPAGAMLADPTVSAPEAVERVMRARGLARDPAALWLQLLALGEPTDARLRGSGWERAALEAAASVLITRGLVTEVQRQGSTRRLFVAEPLVQLDRYPAPIEHSKLEHLRLEEGRRPPLDVPLPCEPLPELFARLADRCSTGS
jgi:hypothetical protein